MSLVTLSASYGAGGSQVGPALAKRLNVPFVDRVIPSDVAARLAVPLGDVLSHDGLAGSRLLTSLLTSLAPVGHAYGAGGLVTEPVNNRGIREATDQIIFEHAEAGQGVILGRAGAVVLRDDSRALHVRLDGPREGRLQQAMRLQDIERDAAERRMGETDRARYAYVRRFHHTNARDAALYHLILDSTIIDLAACVEIVALAVEGRVSSAVDPARTRVASR